MHPIAPIRPAADAAVGVDGCPGGWIAARLTDSGVHWDFAATADIAGLLSIDACIGIDMPIGLLEAGTRDCDDLARRELPGAGSRVFTTPPRPVLELGPGAPNADAQELSRAHTGRGVSRQSLHLAPRILALDAALRALPGHRVVEVHPELSFAELTGQVLERKASEAGARQRAEALGPWLSSVDGRDADRIVEARPAGVPAVDALDALAALWSAVRWRDGRARTLPADATAPPFIAV